MNGISTSMLNRKREEMAKKAEELANLPKTSEEVGAARAIEVIRTLETAEEIKNFVPAKERESVIRAAMDRQKEIATLAQIREGK